MAPKLPNSMKDEISFYAFFGKKKELDASFEANSPMDASFGVLSTTESKDYNRLKNLPTLNDVEIIGNKTSADYGLDTIHSDTTEHWNSQLDLVGQKNHLYIYTDFDTVDGVNIPAIKVGDGNAYLIDIPFITDNQIRLNKHINDTSVHITEDERLFWNDKVTCFLSQDNNETVVFTKENLLNG